MPAKSARPCMLLAQNACIMRICAPWSCTESKCNFFRQRGLKSVLNFSSAEKCNTCDEYILSGQDDDVFILSGASSYSLKALEIEIIVLLDSYSQEPKIVVKPGKYFNKPPPFKLA